MTRQYNIGDIVKISKKERYYMVTDRIDYTQVDDDEPTIDYELALILPIKDSEVEILPQERLELVAEKNSKNHELIMDYIKRERYRCGLEGEPYYINVLNPISDSKHEDKPREKNKFNQTEFNKMFKSKSGERKIERLVDEMNKRLELLHKALQEGRSAHAESHTEKLEEIRRELMELEYFQFEKRRAGYSIIIKD